VVHRYVPLADRYRITGRAHRPVGCLNEDRFCTTATMTTASKYSLTLEVRNKKRGKENGEKKT
jgi:hypothetical protein